MPKVTFNRPAEVYLKGNPTPQRYEKGHTEDSTAFDVKLLRAMVDRGDVAVEEEAPILVLPVDSTEPADDGSDDDLSSDGEPAVEKRGRGRPKGKIARANPESDAAANGTSSPPASATVTLTAPQKAPDSVEIGEKGADLNKALSEFGIVQEVTRIS